VSLLIEATVAYLPKTGPNCTIQQQAETEPTQHKLGPKSTSLLSCQ